MILRRPYIPGVLFALLWTPAFSQLDFGVNAGLFAKQSSSPEILTQTNGIFLRSDNRNQLDQLFIGVFLTHNIVTKLRIKHELACYTTWHVYELLIPTNTVGLLLNVSGAKFLTLNYRGLFVVRQKGKFAFRVGPSVDFNILIESASPYSQYPDANELMLALRDSFNPATLYADIEVGFKLIRWLEILLNYKYGLTSDTKTFVYDGNVQGVRTNTYQYAIRVAYLFGNKQEPSMKE